jgi:hypothetical protein
MGYFNDASLDRTAEDAELDRRDGLLDLPLISSYTRAQALADGVLIDVTDTAREAGFVWPVAVTAALWADIEAIPPALVGVESTAGRLWDVLWMAYCAIRRADDTGGTQLTYGLLMQVGESRRIRYAVKLVSGPGDDAEPVITLMRPDES